MKKLGFIAGLAITTLFLVLLTAAGCSSNQAELAKLKADNQQLKEIAGPPPSSLDQYFPPKAQSPVYLVEMFNLAGPFGGIGADLQGGDMAGVKNNFNAFKAQYDKVAKMVPEWTSQFPSASVDDLGKAIDSGNPAQIGPAMGKVGEVCGSCHLVNMVKVQQQYHWKNFDEIKVTDPISNKELDFLEYMTAMEGTFGGAMNSLAKGQMDKAVQNWQAFQTQYETLGKEGCKQCHVDPVTQKEIPRKDFVDADSVALIDQLGKALAATPPDASAVQNLSGAIGNEICLKCHWVHFPAQYEKDRWDTFTDLFK